jgi:predicted Fe-S protein YdhL (DUF1289 family)
MTSSMLADMSTATNIVAGVASPCTQVCRIDAQSGLCLGCARTLDEIAAWSSMDDDQKQAVVDALATRPRPSSAD